GLLLFFMNWKAVARAFGTLTSFLGQKRDQDDPMERIEVPGSWFITGYVMLGLAAIWLGHTLFHIQHLVGLVDVPPTVLLVGAARRARRFLPGRGLGARRG